MIVTNGRDVHLSAVDLRKRAHQRSITELSINPDDRLYRQHVLAPDSRRKLPNIVTAFPDALSVSRLYPDTTKVDVGALDLGMAFMTGLACRRYDRPDFIYTIKAKTKAAYQPTIKAQKEFDVVKNNATITAITGPLSAKMAINVYESSLGTFDRNPDGSIQQEELVVLATLFGTWTNIIHDAVAPDVRYMVQMKKILSGTSASEGPTSYGARLGSTGIYRLHPTWSRQAGAI
ncbi:hypothetical protein BGX24_008989 [Mortierella sp. AD032]|nr:hypothetical protein BGX24_008989 [Mortierella sp. AD032]